MNPELFDFVMVCQVIVFGVLIVVGYIAKWLVEGAERSWEDEDARLEALLAIKIAKEHAAWTVARNRDRC